MTLLGFAPAWVGLAYAAGFLVPLWILCYRDRAEISLSETNPDGASQALAMSAKNARRVAVGIAPCVVVAVVVAGALDGQFVA